MGKVNVYLPDDLEAAVRASGLSISAICQQAVVDVLATAEVLTTAAATTAEGAHRDLASVLAGATRITPRLRAILSGLADDPASDQPITAHDVFRAIVLHGDNVGAQILRMAGVELPPQAAPPRVRTRARSGSRRAPARPRALDEAASAVLSDALRVAIELRHNYVGAEHVVIALATPPSPLAEMFAVLGVDDGQLRRHVEVVVGSMRTAAPAQHPTERVDRLERDLAELRSQVETLTRRVGGRSR